MQQTHYLSAIDTVNMETIVYNLKYALEHSSHQEYLDTLDMQLKQKNEDIEHLCLENHQEIIENFKRFLLHQRLLQGFASKVGLFSDKIYKISLRNKYDTSEISNKRKAIANIDNTLDHLSQVMEVFSLLGKAVDNLSNEKFMASIRTVAQIKKKPLLLPQNSNSMVKHVFSEVSPLIFSKIRGKADGFLNDWVHYSKAKQLEIGLSIVAFYEDAFRTALSSFSISLLPASTTTNRESMYFGNKTERHDDISGINAGFKDSFAPRYTLSQFKTRFFEFKVDYHLVNQCQQIYNSMNEYVIFVENMRNFRQKQLIALCETPVANAKEMRGYVCQLMGFFVIERELTKQFNQYNCLEAFWIDSIRKIDKNMINCFENLKNSNDFLEIKHELHLFSFVVQKLGFQGQSNKLLLVIKDNFLRFSEKIINTYLPNLVERINNDGFACMRVSTLQEYEQLSRIFDENFHESTSFQSQEFTFKFTEVMPEIAELVRKFLQNNLLYLRGVTDLEGLIHIQLDRFYFKIYESFKILIDKRLLNILQVGQTIENIVYMGNSLKYFRNVLENSHKILCSREYESVFYFDQLKMTCEELIQEMTKQKINEFLENYFMVDWEPSKHVNGKNQGFVQDMGDFLIGVFQALKMINAEIVSSLIYLSFRHVNVQILNILCDEKIKHFNILGLVNLQFDIVYLFGLCGNDLREYSNLMETLREIRQFLDLFLVGHPSDLLDLSLRNTKYNQLNLQKIVLLFKKYKKVVVGKYPVIRKRQVKATMDKLKLEFQNI